MGITRFRHQSDCWGGYGIFLKAEYIREKNIRTLFSEYPKSRSTNDIDIFLRPEFLIVPGKLKPLSQAIEKLGYSVIESARNYQFFKAGSGGIGEIKIDILTGPQSSFNCGSPDSIKRMYRRATNIKRTLLLLGPICFFLALCLVAGAFWRGDIHLIRFYFLRYRSLPYSLHVLDWSIVLANGLIWF